MNTELVRGILREKGMRQQDLARATGCTPAAISRYVNGIREPRAETAARLAEALGIELDLLMGIKQKLNADGLRSCPFCGSERVQILATASCRGIQHFAVGCSGCKASGPLAETTEGAEQAWNGETLSITGGTASRAAWRLSPCRAGLALAV